MAFEKYHVVGDMLCEWVDRCTCGVPPARPLRTHEPGCGLEMIAPIDQLLAPITAEDVREAIEQWHVIPCSEIHPGAPHSENDCRASFIADHLNRRTPAPSTPTPPAGTSDAGNEKENEG